MKKILGISLCALFAVSAANANIASTEWVQEQIGGIDTQAIATNTANITALDGRVTQNTTNIGTNTQSITALDGRVTQNTTNIGTNTQSITALDGRVTQNETDIDSLQATAQGLGALATKDAVTNAEITDNTIKNADIATDAAIATTKIAFSTQQTAALNSGITSESVNKIDDNADAISENAGAITALDGRVTQNTTNIGTNTQSITALDGRVTQNTTNIGTNTQSITALDGRVTQNETDIDSLQATAQGLGALATKDAVTNAEITDNTIKNADIATDAAIAMVKIDFSGEQTGAINSGIDSAKVAQIGTNTSDIAENAGAIAINKTNIQSNSDDIVALKSRTADLKALAYKDKVAAGDINPGAIVDADISDSARIATTKIAFSDAQKNALNSTIDSAKVTQIATNASNIGTLQTTVSEHNEALKPSSECMNNADGCTLVYRNNAYSWEKITREAQ